jgi:hypothetical protein
MGNRPEQIENEQRHEPLEKQGPAFTLADAKLGDVASAAARRNPMQDFVDGFGHLGKLYDDAVHDLGRMARFQDRMGTLFKNDRPTFNELAKVGEGLSTEPPASAEQTGRALADAFANAVERQQQQGDVDLVSPANQSMEGAFVGVMLAARANIPPDQMKQDTEAMVDAFDKRLRERGTPFVAGVVYGDTGEPGIAVVAPGEQIDRHHFGT